MFNFIYNNKDVLLSQYEINDFTNGLDADSLEREVRKITESEPHRPTAKAKAIAFILRNAGIDHTEGELFADKINDGGIMLRLRDKWESERKNEPDCAPYENEAKYAAEHKIYSATMDFGHLSPDWDYLLEVGISGVIRDLKLNRERHADDKERLVYYDNTILVWEAYSDFAIRLAELCESRGSESSLFTAKNLRAIANRAPRSLAEGMQLTMLHYTVQQNLDNVFVRSLGGIDHLYYPLYKGDIESGSYTEAELRAISADFLFKCTAKKANANIPFYVGGKDKDGNDLTNDYTLVLLEEYRKLDVHDPKIHVMWHENMRPDVVDYILDSIREGKNSFLFANLDVASATLRNIGVEPEDAKRVTIYGCYEEAAEGTEVPATCGGVYNTVKTLELVLNRGIDTATGVRVGRTDKGNFVSFDELLSAFYDELEYLSVKLMDTISRYERGYERVCTSVFCSPTFKSSRESGIDIYLGGAKYNNTSIVYAGIATLADSLIAIKEAVYEKKLVSFSEMVDCLSKNFEGYEALHRFVRLRAPKFGNNRPEVDKMAADIIDKLSDIVNGRKNGRGGVFRLGLFSIDWRFNMGKAIGATPDGRLSGEPVSKNAAPTIGADREGVTAYLSSVTAIDAKKIPDGIVADVTLHSSAVAGDDGFGALRALLISYMRRGGFAIHFNVLNPDTLREAQINPEKHKNLQIRLCGWNVHFVNLDRSEQDEFIMRSESCL